MGYSSTRASSVSSKADKPDDTIVTREPLGALEENKEEEVDGVFGAGGEGKVDYRCVFFLLSSSRGSWRVRRWWEVGVLPLRTLTSVLTRRTGLSGGSRHPSCSPRFVVVFFNFPSSSFPAFSDFLSPSTGSNWSRCPLYSLCVPHSRSRSRNSHPPPRRRFVSSLFLPLWPFLC
jgi:hypothetical protein